MQLDYGTVMIRINEVDMHLEDTTLVDLPSYCQWFSRSLDLIGQTIEAQKVGEVYIATHEQVAFFDHEVTEV